MQVTYADFPVLTPTKSDKAVGGVALTGHIYCRPCIERLHLDFAEMKYITKTRAGMYIYNCTHCGNKLSKHRMGKMDSIGVVYKN
jgi:predicted SprT family Zn-dependent metalloprotease